MNDNKNPEASGEEVDPLLALAASIGDEVVDELNAEFTAQHEESMQEFANAKEVHADAKQKEEFAMQMRDWLGGLAENTNFDDLENPHEWLKTGMQSYEELGVKFSEQTKGFVKELGATYEGIEALIASKVTDGVDEAKMRERIMGNEKLQAQLKAKFTPILERMKKETADFHADAAGKEENAYKKTQGFNESLQLITKGTKMPEIKEANIETLREIFRKGLEEKLFGEECNIQLSKLNQSLNYNVPNVRGYYNNEEGEKKAKAENRAEYLETDKGKEAMAEIKQQELLRDVVGPYIVDMMVKNMEAFVAESNPEDPEKAVADFFSKKDLLSEFQLASYIRSSGFEIKDKISISYQAKKDSEDPDNELYYVVMNGEGSEPDDLKKDDVLMAKEIVKAKALLKLALATDMNKKGQFENQLQDYYVLAMVFNKFDELMKMDRKVVCDSEDRFFARDPEMASRVRDDNQLYTDVFADYLKRIPSADPQFLGLMQAIYNFMLQTSKVKEGGKDYSYSRREASMTRVFDSIFRKRTRDGVWFEKGLKDDILESHAETVKGLREFEAKAGEKPNAILSVEDARGAVDRLNVEYARRVDGIMTELETLRKEREAQEQEMERAINRLGTEAEGDKKSLQQSITDLQRTAESHKQRNEQFEGQVENLQGQLTKLKETYDALVTEYAEFQIGVKTDILEAARSTKDYYDKQKEKGRLRRDGVIDGFDKSVKPAMTKLGEKYLEQPPFSEDN